MTDMIRKSDALALPRYEPELKGVREDRAGMEACEGGEWVSADALAALPAVVPGVKPLVWVDRYAKNAWSGYYIADAAGPDQSYDWFKWCQSSRGDFDESDEHFPTEAAAKAAAQADYAARILAALEPVPAPKVMHEDAPAAIISEIGNQIHNLGCEMQNDEDVSLRLSDLAIRLWDAAKLFAAEPDALRAIGEPRNG